MCLGRPLFPQVSTPSKFELVSYWEDFYFIVDHFRIGCYFNDGITGGIYFNDDYEEDCYCNIDTFENRCYFTADIFEEVSDFNNGNEDCYFTTDQGAEETPGAYQEASTSTLAIKDQLLRLGPGKKTAPGHPKGPNHNQA